MTRPGIEPGSPGQLASLERKKERKKERSLTRIKKERFV